MNGDDLEIIAKDMSLKDIKGHIIAGLITLLLVIVIGILLLMK